MAVIQVNKRQLEVLKYQMQNEKKILQLLKQVYQRASMDCERKIRELAGRTDMENLQSIIYQKQYQEALKKQLDGILDALQNKEFENIAEYLTGCYEDGFLGALYDIHGQGIPLIIPIDQVQVVDAVLEGAAHQEFNAQIIGVFPGGRVAGGLKLAALAPENLPDDHNARLVIQVVRRALRVYRQVFRKGLTDHGLDLFACKVCSHFCNPP